MTQRVYFYNVLLANSNTGYHITQHVALGVIALPIELSGPPRDAIVAALSTLPNLRKTIKERLDKAEIYGNVECQYVDINDDDHSTLLLNNAED